jgi:cell division septation protein DedD
MKAKADQVVDHMIDALARAIAYSSSDAARYAQARTTWMEGLTNYYKYRNNGSDTGLKELIAGITSKPVPKPGEPVAPMTPQTTPASTTAPTQPNGTSSTQPSGTSTTAKPNGTTTPATTTAQPASKTSSTKTTPKRAHSSRKRG